MVGGVGGVGGGGGCGGGGGGGGAEGGGGGGSSRAACLKIPPRVCLWNLSLPPILTNEAISSLTPVLFSSVPGPLSVPGLRPGPGRLLRSHEHL